MNKNVKLLSHKGKYLHFAFEFHTALLKKQNHKCLISDVNYEKNVYMHEFLIKKHIKLKEHLTSII